MLFSPSSCAISGVPVLSDQFSAEFWVLILCMIILIILIILIIFILVKSFRLESRIASIATRLESRIASIATRIDRLENQLKWIEMILPERLDFWHAKTENTKAPYNKPKNLTTTVAKHYGSEGGTNTCALTGLRGTSSEVVVAHLLPRRNTDFAFSIFGLDAKDARDGMRNVMFLCKGIEEAFDEKRISFARNSDGELGLHIWDESVESNKVWKSHEKSIGDYKTNVLRFPGGKIPYTRILSYHHRICFTNAKMRGWFSDDAKMPDDTVSPFKTETIPLEIYVHNELESHHSGNQTPRKQAGSLPLNTPAVAEETECLRMSSSTVTEETTPRKEAGSLPLNSPTAAEETESLPVSSSTLTDETTPRMQAGSLLLNTPTVAEETGSLPMNSFNFETSDKN